MIVAQNDGDEGWRFNGDADVQEFVARFSRRIFFPKFEWDNARLYLWERNVLVTRATQIFVVVVVDAFLVLASLL